MSEPVLSPALPADGASAPAAADGIRYWRSLEQREQLLEAERGLGGEFQEVLLREFPEDAEQPPDEVSRRGFLSAIAASVALASLSGCRKPKTLILPFNKRPEGFKPGIAQSYATVLTRGGFGIGVLARSNDGRPTKLEGNPEHPGSLGGSDMQLQAELLQLYDPARSREVHGPGVHVHGDDQGHGDHGGGHGDHGGHGAEAHASGFEVFSDWWDKTAKELVSRSGAGLHVLMPPTTSPTLLSLADKAKVAFPQARFHLWEPLHRDAELEGAERALGRRVETHVDYSKCDVVVSLDCDFLGSDGDVIRASKQWSKTRRAPAPGQQLSRLYVFEATFSTTGTVADHRFRTKAGDVARAAFALAAALEPAGDVGAAAETVKGTPFLKNGKDVIAAIVEDLKRARGRCAVVAGPRQPAVVHAVAHALNKALGNVGQTVTYTQLASQGEALPKKGCAASLQELKDALEQDQVEVLVLLDANPVYDAPAELEFGKSLAKAKHSIHVGLHRDETGTVCDWHFPLAHELESWGDARARDGTAAIRQPLIEPLHGGVSAIEFLGFLTQQPNYETLRDARNCVFGHELVKAYWQGASGADDFERGFWPRALHDGVVGNSAFGAENVSLDAAAVGTAVRAWKQPEGREVVLRACPKMLDGRYANNPWMQEVPDPLTKLTWDNAALVSPKTAADLGVANGDLLSIDAAGRPALQIPAWILPGHADDSVTVYLGWGRKLSAQHQVVRGGDGRSSGFDGYVLRTAASPWLVANATIGKAGGSYPLVCTQEHGTMAGRAIVRETTAANYAADPEWAPKQSPLDRQARVKGKTEKDVLKSLWTHRYDEQRNDLEVKRSPYQWGMVIDLNTCTGCSACVVACIAENNIPMVGKAQVAKSRELLWIRADRYFTDRGAEQNLHVAEDPQVMNQPVPCMQCENAPCESVCPVLATTHSPDGLNDMVYNRCIGTRYCSNNCPYKVRRFNWLDFTGQVPETRKLAFNPDVTVRSRGVMEKCTYCVQRINGGRIRAKLEGRTVRDGEIQPACAQACPTEAITFGNLLDKSAKVTQLKAMDLDYAMLSDLNTRPRTTYLGRVRNPNPNLA